MTPLGEGAALLIDDDPDDRFLVEQAWREAGLANKLFSVDGGHGALDYLFGRGAFADRSRYPLPAFVLIDIKMPGMSGFEVLEKIRADPGLRPLPVFVLTASTSQRDVNEAYRLGANGFFVKPSSIQELVELLAALKTGWLRFNQFPQL